MENNYSRMTVNERLYVSGLLAAFDKAVSERDIAKVISILKEVEVNEASIKSILEELNLGDEALE